jgi:hypothetical protein
MTKRRKTTGLTPAGIKAGSRPKGGYEVAGTLRPPERVPRILGGGKGLPLSKAGAAIVHPEQNQSE